MTHWKKATGLAAKRSQKAFGRVVAAAHGRKRGEREADLASRNAYRRAIGLPEVKPT